MRRGVKAKGDEMFERVNYAVTKMAEQNTESHHHKNPNQESLYFRIHGHTPKGLMSSRASR